MCAISEGLNCETVALSPWSVFGGLPVSVWGILGYMVIICLAVSSLVLNSRSQPLYGALLGFCTIAFLASTFLATISFSKIDSLCLFCMGTYVINALLFVAIVTLLIKQKIKPVAAVFADLQFLIRKPLLLGLIILVGAGPMATAYALITPYWHTAGFENIPTLSTGVDENGDHWIGATKPRVTIVEYTDYECPYCRSAHKQLRELLAKYSDSVRVIHRHFPLDQACNPKVTRKFHAHACKFSAAAECAAHDGKFWEMNDAIFSSQDNQKSDAIDVEKFAIQLGLDRSEFNQCLESDDTRQAILHHIKQGAEAHISATPTFVVNGQMFKGRLTEEQLTQLLKAAE